MSGVLRYLIEGETYDRASIVRPGTPVRRNRRTSFGGSDELVRPRIAVIVASEGGGRDAFDRVAANYTR